VGVPALQDDDAVVTPGASASPATRGVDPHRGIKGRRPSKKDKLRKAAAAAAASRETGGKGST
jgi:hypothetical protein